MTLLRIVTLLAVAAMTSGLVMSFESMTVPGAVIVAGPVYGVSATPAGTPVFDAFGKLESAGNPDETGGGAAGVLVVADADAEGLDVAVDSAVAVGLADAVAVGVADAVAVSLGVALGIVDGWLDAVPLRPDTVGAGTGDGAPRFVRSPGRNTASTQYSLLRHV